MRITVIIFATFLIALACMNNNSHPKNDIPKNGFNASKVLSDTNFFARWEKANLESIDSITLILIREANYSQEMINDLKANIRDGKMEKVVNGRKVFGSHKWLLNKLNGYMEQLDTTLCNSMFIIELNKSGEVNESIDWVVLFLNDQCRLILTVAVDDSVIVRTQDKSINKTALENLIKENYPNAIMTNKCLDKGEGLPMADLYVSKFTENRIEVFAFPTFCSGFYRKFLSLMQE